MKKLAVQKEVEIINIRPKTMNNKYLLFLPKEYKTAKKQWPLILFLHGAGERGNDLELVKKHGPPKIVENQNDLPFIIVSPQCKEEMRWHSSELNNLLDEVIAHYKVDTNRIYLTGLSMGGFGAWDMAVKYPDKFAAIAPVCGGGDPNEVCAIKDLPVWAFHGAKDNVVPVKRSEEMVKALKACGGNPLFTVYPDADHDSWTETYNNPNLYLWFLQHKKI